MTLIRPATPLGDGSVRLRPLSDRDLDGFALLAADPSVRRGTRVPDAPPDGFAEQWLARYLTGWTDGTLAGFAIEGATPDHAWLGFAGVVAYDAETAEGELGYIVARHARGRGVAGRALALLDAWALDEAPLTRAELVIDVGNAASLVVAARAGFTYEGIRRGTWIKAGKRTDVAIWSALRGEQRASDGVSRADVGSTPEPDDAGVGVVSRRTLEPFAWGDACLGWRLVDEAGLQVIEEHMPPSTSERLHMHVRATQSYLVLAGEATVDLEDSSEVLLAGDAVLIAPGRPHRISNRSGRTLEFLVLSSAPTRADRIDLQ